MESICSSCRCEFIVNENTIYCKKCKRWFCENCWISYCDEGFPSTEDSAFFFKCEQGEYGQFLVNECDPCQWGSDTE